MVDFDRLNRETKAFKDRDVNRFNPSTKSNYRPFDPNYLNNETYKHNNGQYSNYFSNRSK